MSEGRFKISIVGGGSLGHVIAGYLAAKSWIDVTVVTRDVSSWGDVIEVTDLSGKVFAGHLCRVTDSYRVACDADMVLLCLPGFAIADVLTQLAPHVTASNTIGSVVSSTGFFIYAHRLLPSKTALFGFQRVPFIARVDTYGHSARLLGYKNALNVAVEQCEGAELTALLSRLFDLPVNVLANFYEASLTNSNPLLHPARLFTMWRGYNDGDTYMRCPEFYSEWTDEASSCYINMDKEFQSLLTVLPVTTGAIPDVLTYYESCDVPSLTAKLRSISAFKGIMAPMKKCGGGFVPDFTSRYFTEDFPHGMGLILQVASEHGIDTPLIQHVYQWGMSKLQR